MSNSVLDSQLKFKSSLSTDRKLEKQFFLPKIGQQREIEINSKIQRNKFAAENSLNQIKELNQVDIKFSGIPSSKEMQTRIHNQYDNNFSRQQTHRIKRQMSLAARSGQTQVLNNLQILNVNQNKLNSLNNEQNVENQESQGQNNHSNSIQASQQSLRYLQSNKNIANFNNQLQYQSINKSEQIYHNSIYTHDGIKQKKGKKPQTKDGRFLPPAVSSQSQKPTQKFVKISKNENDSLQISGNIIQLDALTPSDQQKSNVISQMETADVFSAYNILSQKQNHLINNQSIVLANQSNYYKNVSNSQNFQSQSINNYKQKKNGIYLQSLSKNSSISQQKNENVPLGSRQFENYLQKKDTIEQQRQKKKELLKQLDMGLKSNNNQCIDNLAVSQTVKSDNYAFDMTEDQNLVDIDKSDEAPTSQMNCHQNICNINSRNISPIEGCQENTELSMIMVQENQSTSKRHISNKISQDTTILANMHNQDQQLYNFIDSPSKGYGQANYSQDKQNVQDQKSNFFQDNSNEKYKKFNLSQNKSISNFKVKQELNYKNLNMENIGEQKQEMGQNQNKIAKKGEGSRSNKMHDYVFIVMSQENFQNAYAKKKILIQNKLNDSCKIDVPKKTLPSQSPKQKLSSQNLKLSLQSQSLIEMNSKRQKLPSHNKSIDKNSKVFGIGQLLSPTNNNAIQEQIDLNGIVQIRAYDSCQTDELPQVQCNLQPTQLDHLKVLICDQVDKYHPKLTQEAEARFELEKQFQVQQYMQDIIAKLKKKQRRFKISTKRKFVDDALYKPTNQRIASVYVIVINRESLFDKTNSVQKLIQLNPVQESANSSSEEDFTLEQQEQLVKHEQIKNNKLRESLRMSYKYNKISMYESDTNEANNSNDNNQSFETANNMVIFNKIMKSRKPVRALNSLNLKKNGGLKIRDDDIIRGYKFQYVEKEYVQKYGPSKIKIVQDINAHSHHQKHILNVFFSQYNEFIKLVIKNQKLQQQGPSTTIAPAYKFNHIYAIGLAKAIGMNLKKDAFNEQNMKSRDYVNQLKEKLIFCFWRKLNESNKDLTPHLNPYYKDQANSNEEIDGETQDSSSTMNNTPGQGHKTLKQSNIEQNLNSSSSQIVQVIGIPAIQNTNFPPQNVLYKYFIGKGNNSIMVRNMFKNRFWWIQHEKEELEKCNFCWTQIKKPNIMDVLPCKFPHMKSGIKNINYNNQGISQNTQTPIQKSNKKKRMDSINSDKSQGSKQNSGPQIQNSTSLGQQNIVQQNEIIQKWTEYKLYNKIEDNFHLNNKKALFINMKNYYEAMDQDVFDNLPVTFHIKNGIDDQEFQKFKQYYFKLEDQIKNKKLQQKIKKKENIDAKEKTDIENQTKQSPSKKVNSKEQIDEKETGYYQSPAPPKNIWIIKPGENTNRGHGIQVAKEFEEIKQIILESTTNGRRTCIVQKYIHNPLLINRRKFDIRTYVLMTSINGNTKVYIYEEGYLRTSCREYSVNNLANKLVHLTNDAVQKKAEDYGKFEPGNKLSYIDFQVFLDKSYPDLNICFERDIKSQMNKLTTDIFRSVYTKLDPKRRLHCMEVFGLDFMIDDEFKPYLIEVNTNPCLELASPLLSRLIPTMIENALKIGLDPIFLPPESFSTKKAYIGDPCPENRFELVFDSIIDGVVLEKLFKNKENMIVEMDEDELSEEEEHDDEE